MLKVVLTSSERWKNKFSLVKFKGTMNTELPTPNENKEEYFGEFLKKKRSLLKIRGVL